jgi:hypothetical protein
MSQLVRLYLDSVGAADPKDMRKLFGWRMQEMTETLSHLKETKIAIPLDDGRWATGKVF